MDSQTLLRLRPYQKLVAWKEAHALCLWTYKVTETFPRAELYRLVNQMCRSSSSVSTNIAEGSGKKSKRERARFYETGLCSLEELHYQFVLSLDLGYINDGQFTEVEDHIKRTSYLLNRLHSSCFLS